MTYDKIKSLEASILEAIQKYDCDPKELTKFAEECFVSHRARNLYEKQLKSYENWNKSLEREISRHKACIKDLRGYISYLEKENENLEREKEQE